MGEQGLFTTMWIFFSKWILPWLPSMFGSAIGVWFLRKGMTAFEIAINFLIGVTIAYYTVRGLVSWHDITNEYLVDVLKIGVAMFVYTGARELFRLMPSFIEALKDKLLSVIDRFLALISPKP